MTNAIPKAVYINSIKLHILAIYIISNTVICVLITRGECIQSRTVNDRAWSEELH